MPPPRISSPRLPVAPLALRLEALVVEDDPFCARGIERILLTLEVEPTTVPTAAEAQRALRREPFAAALVDLHLGGDRAGLELVRHIRETAPSTRCLLMTGDNDPAAVNDAHLVGVEILLKPFGTEHLRAFVGRVRAQLGPLRATLTPAERQIVELGRQGLARKAIAEELGISENTVKTHTKRLLQKTGDASLAVLATRIAAKRD